MGFTRDPGMVRGLLFVRRLESEGFSGKWKYEIALDMGDYYDHPESPESAVEQAWKDGKQSDVVKTATGFWLVVPDPYHKYSYPVMVAI